MNDDLAARGRAIVDDGLYLVLGTADADGRPWTTPVYFAHSGYREFVWVSKPGAQHSRNIEARPEVSIVVFDSTVPIGTGGGEFTEADVLEPARLRLYRATASEQFVLDEKDERIPVDL